jgi:hypothetical protein
LAGTPSISSFGSGNGANWPHLACAKAAGAAAIKSRANLITRSRRESKSIAKRIV